MTTVTRYEIEGLYAGEWELWNRASSLKNAVEVRDNGLKLIEPNKGQHCCFTALRVVKVIEEREVLTV